MEYKHQAEYDDLSVKCPPTDFTASNMEPVYRWVFGKIEDERNFIPQFLKNPKRFLTEDDMTKCKALSLSLFSDLGGSIERFNELRKYIGDKVYGTLGDRVAIGKLVEEDGVNGEIKRLGHFTHHTAVAADYGNFILTEKEL